MEMKLTDLEQWIDSLPGLMMIDLEGKVTYMNNQCADYFKINRDAVIGKHVNTFFPETQMLENLYINEPITVFYNSYVGIGISVEYPIFDETGRRLGIGEFDVVQGSEVLYELSDDYRLFLDQALNHTVGNLETLGRTKYTLNDLIGTSEVMTKLKQKIISTAKTNSTVMITGETGTGKELAAHAIHNLSTRRREKFIKINAASIPEALFEAELFGYEKGSFTGALDKGKKGKFELADKGTLFIDEINQMPLSVQPKLLRTLQEKEIDPIGRDESVAVDVRIITASNEDLQELVRKGEFREDLYYRLNVIEIRTPPLREHPEDLEEIIQVLVDELNIENNQSIIGVDKEAIRLMKKQPWEGNVRQLKNVIESAMNFTSDNVIHVDDISMNSLGKGVDIDRLSGAGNIIEQARNEAERDVIIKVLNRFGSNKSRAAKYLGIARPLLYQKMRRLGIK
jgi:transcriptional regulator with PAS, ATPase and Fis domain